MLLPFSPFSAYVFTGQCPSIQAFITKWEVSGAAKRANAQPFLNDLGDVLEVERPPATNADEALNSYVFERSVPSPTSTTWRIHLYKRGLLRAGDQAGR